MKTKAESFLYDGYTFEQERDFKKVREQIRILSGPRRTNPFSCEECGKGGMAYRVTTRDYRCRSCHHVQKAIPRFRQ